MGILDELYGVTTETNYKKIHQREHKKISFYLVTLRSQKSEKHVWDAHAYLFSAHSFDAMHCM